MDIDIAQNRDYFALYDGYQTKKIPKKIFFIWMGRREFPDVDENPKNPPKDGRFRRATVAESVKNNKDCEATMWLDIMTMVTSDVIARAVPDARLLHKYYRWWRLALTPHAPGWIAPSPAQPSDSVQVRDPGEFQTVIDLLRFVRSSFARWISKEKNWNQVVKQDDRVRKMVEWCGRTGLKVRLLDTEIYPKWMNADPRAPEYQLVNWVYFELYFRNSNFGAVGDLLRVQILYERGGMYCDHDDKLTWLNNPVTLGRNEKFEGFKHGLILDNALDAERRPVVETKPTTGFMAAPPAHPFLYYYRAKMLEGYQNLLDNRYRWLTPRGLDKTDGYVWFDFRRGRGAVGWLEFAAFAIAITGPDMLEACLGDMSGYFRASAREPRVRGSFANSWT